MVPSFYFIFIFCVDVHNMENPDLKRERKKKLLLELGNNESRFFKENEELHEKGVSPSIQHSSFFGTPKNPP